MNIKIILSIFLILTSNFLNGALIVNQEREFHRAQMNGYIRSALEKRITRNGSNADENRIVDPFTLIDFTQYNITPPETRLLVQHFAHRFPDFNKKGFEKFAEKKLDKLKKEDPQKFTQLATGVLNHVLQTDPSFKLEETMTRQLQASVSSATVFVRDPAQLQAAHSDSQPFVVPTNTPTRPYAMNAEQLDADFLSYMWQELVTKANTSNVANRNRFLFTAALAAIQLVIWPTVFGTKIAHN